MAYTSTVLTQYLAAAMRNAHYEIVEDSGEFWGEIPGFPGVWACEPTLEACRDQLASVLEGWLLVGIAFHHELPEVEGLVLNVPRVSDVA